MCSFGIRIITQITIIIFSSSIYCIFLFFVIIFSFYHVIILVIFCKTSEGRYKIYRNCFQPRVFLSAKLKILFSYMDNLRLLCAGASWSWITVYSLYIVLDSLRSLQSQESHLYCMETKI